VKATLDRYFKLTELGTTLRTEIVGGATTFGMTAGFVVYPLFKTAAGKVGELQPGMWILGLLSLLFFLFYPY
jgi:xanthine/uracil/vitamin C permease (AzgA family)